MWTSQRRCVEEDVGEDHVDEDLGDEVSAMASQRRVDDNVSLEGVPRGDQMSIPCHDREIDEELHRFPHRPGVWMMHVVVASGRCPRRIYFFSVMYSRTARCRSIGGSAQTYGELGGAPRRSRSHVHVWPSPVPHGQPRQFALK